MFMISFKGILIFFIVFLCVSSKHKKIHEKNQQNSSSTKYLIYFNNQQLKRKANNWENNMCNGRKQSPIKINTKKIKKLSSSKKIQFSDAYYHYPDKMHLVVKDNSLHLGFDYGEKSVPTVKGSALKGTYKINHIVLHWGEFQKGSEHSIDDKTFSMEVQLVHINVNYRNFDESLENDDGVFIYSSLFKLNDKGGTAGIELIAFNMPKFLSHQKYKRFNIQPFPISWLMSDIQNFFFYDGSITYPPCSEVVTWMISSNSLQINSYQLQRFRRLYSKYPRLKNNIREQQKWNGRKIYQRKKK